MSSWKDNIILRSLGGHPILCKRVNDPFQLIRFEGLTQVDKGNIQGFPLLPTLFLPLSQGKDHVKC